MPPVPPNTVADTMMDELGVDITFPSLDLNDPQFNIPDATGNPLYEMVQALTISELTVGEVGGAGTFDQIMKSISAHLSAEFQKGRITGEQFTRAYVELTSASLSSGLTFLLQKDQAKWSAVLVQLQARKAEIEAVTARAQMKTALFQLAAAKSQAEILEAQYVLTQLQIANAVAQYDMTYAQKALIDEQIEAAHAQTSDTLTDGTTPVAGSIGKQKDLYTQQIDSYVKDAKFKVTKMLSDAWIAQKTIDEGLTPPTVFTNAVIQESVENMRQEVELDT